MYPHVYSKLSYDPFQDLTPVSTISEFVHGIAVGPAVPESVKTLPDLIAWFKANPDKASVGNPGEGSLPHFLTMLLARAIGVKIEAISYAGGPPGVKDTLGGQVPAMMATEGQFITYLKDGKLRMLATSGTQRSRFSPQVPTFTEQGVKSIQVSEWIGMFAPAKTPAATVARLSAGVRAGLAQADLVEKFAGYAMHAAGSTPEELGRRLKADHDFWGPAVKSTGFTPLS
jgi:tripartite-type tricarboxylate transporter receptor subunit TctC